MNTSLLRSFRILLILFILSKSISSEALQFGGPSSFDLARGPFFDNP